MVTAFTFRVGDIVKDTKFGFVWTVVCKDGEGGVHLSRNGVTAYASIWDLEGMRPRQQAKSDARQASGTVATQL